MSNLVIVAIPAADDRVWKISSEKVPHLTMLFLGEEPEDATKVERITEFVEHAVKVSECGPFGLQIDHRDVLGPDQADVVHFRRDYEFKWINTLRGQLLQQPDIRAAYDSTPQYPEWLPHLTLGYPASPAKEVDSEYGLHWIQFDRIAVWTGDYEGPEFRLEWPELALEPMGAWSSLGKEFASSLVHISETPWSEFTKADYSVVQWHAACLIHQHAGAPTSKSECKLPVKTPDGAVNRNGVHAAAAALSGARGGVQATDEEKSKAMAALRGLYKKLDEEPPKSLTQTADFEAEFLSHYGVKGMRWGQRREGGRAMPTAVPPQARSHVPQSARRKTKVKVDGGENHPAHPDAIKVAEAKVKLKKSGPAALSNTELREVANRLQLESQVKQLTTSGGQKYVANLLKTQGQQEVNQQFQFHRQTRRNRSPH